MILVPIHNASALDISEMIAEQYGGYNYEETYPIVAGTGTLGSQAYNPYITLFRRLLSDGHTAVDEGILFLRG